MILLTFHLKIAWQIVFLKALAKADNLITAVKTRILLDVDVYPDFRTLTEQRPSYQLGVAHSCTTVIVRHVDRVFCGTLQALHMTLVGDNFLQHNVDGN